MARPQKIGLDYFPLDNNISDDDKIFYIESEHGITGFAVYIKLLTRIYDNGYFIEWDKFRQNVLARKINVDINTLLGVVNSCVECNLFNKKILDQYNILTSKAIQKRYFEATSRRKSVSILNDYCLVDINDYNNIELKGVNVDINPKSDVINDNISTQRKEEKSKEEEKKEKTKDNKELYLKSFEEVWALYPHKKGKGSITKSDSKLKRIHNDKEELIRCVNRYKEYIEYRRNNDFKTIKYMDGSRFFNTDYIDYLDENYQDVKELKEKKIQKPKPFSELNIVEVF